MSRNNRNRRWAGGVGMAIGAALAAALAATPGTASADSSTDWLSSIDQLLGGLSVPAQTTPLDMQVSIDGMDLFPTAGNTATASSGTGLGDIAIAIGNNSDAAAGVTVPCPPLFPCFGQPDLPGGSFNFAFADGASSTATATGLFDSATVIGADSSAGAGGSGFLSGFDLAAAFGDMVHATAFGFFQVDIVP